jgi:hypothetical protein
MKKYRLLINFIVVTIVFIIMYYNLVPSEEENNCMLDKRFRNLVFDGVITNKYYDKTEHSYPTLDVKALNNDSIQKINLIGEKSHLFNLLQTSDTILKEKHSDIVMRKRNGVYSIFMKADFDCKDRGIK